MVKRAGIGTAACAGFPAGGRPRRWEGVRGCGRGAVPAEIAARVLGREKGEREETAARV
jgi:hypothetical protein